MVQLKIIFVFILAHQALFAQKKANEFAAVDKIALQLPDSLSRTTDDIASYIVANFKTHSDKSRAIFIWVASNIEYDIENMFALNFYEKKEDKISRALKSRKGICENYAVLFTEICAKSGLSSYVVEGYTKQASFVDFIPHAWSAALIDSTWFLFDPTWGAGYIDGEEFVKKVSNNYYKVTPASLIESHMPFDFLWQFLHYPVTNQEFYQGKTQQNKTKPFFNFNDSIHVYNQQEHIQQLISSARRVEQNGVKNSLIFDRLQHLKIEIENFRNSKAVNLYNLAIVDYNDGIKAFNDFINYRNKQFSPIKSDAEIQKMLDLVDQKFKEARTKVTQISNPEITLASMIPQLTKSLDEADQQLQEQQRWLKLYFSKKKPGRRSMFYKVSWFGIPLN